MLILFPSLAKASSVFQNSTPHQNVELRQKNTSSLSSFIPKPLNNSSQAYVAPNYQAVSKDDKTMPPRGKFSNANWNALQLKLKSNATLMKMFNQAKSNPNLLLSNTTIAQALESSEEIQSIDIIPNGHSSWGTEILTYTDLPFPYGIAYVYGGFAKQYISNNLDLTTSPDESKTLFSPTFTLPLPCPVEVSTVYGHVANTGTDKHIGLYDFRSTWQTNGIFPIQIDNNTWIFDAATTHPYYFVEIQYWINIDQWDVYMWNRDVWNWQLVYSADSGYYGELKPQVGWDVFEAAQDNGDGYDDSFAAVNIQRPIESSYLMLDWGYDPGFLSWQYANPGTAWVTQFDSSWWNSNTAFAQRHYYATQYSTWIVVGSADPPLTVLAYDEYSGSYVDNIPVSVDENWVASSSTIELDSGSHSISAASDTGGAFDYFDVNGVAYYDNPATVTITNETSVTVFYHYIPTYTVYFSAIDYTYWISLYPNVCIDGNYVGTCPTSVQVSLGYHSITYDWQVWNDYIQSYDNIWCIGIGVNWPSNGATVPIVADTNTCGIYMPS